MQSNLIYHRYRDKFKALIETMMDEGCRQAPVRAVQIAPDGQNVLSVGLSPLSHINMEHDSLLFIGLKYKEDFFWWADDTRSKPSEIIRFVIANAGVD